MKKILFFGKEKREKTVNFPKESPITAWWLLLLLL